MSRFIEDIFLDFYRAVSADRIPVQWHDSTPINSFVNVIKSGNSLTRAQSDYVLRILSKYKNKSKEIGLDYDQYLDPPLWKKSFRIIDYTKKIHIESNEGNVNICLKFPFDFKKTFDLEFQELLDKGKNSTWDPDRKIRVIPIYDVNLIKLNEFVSEHGFEIDDSFAGVVSIIEETWDQQDSIIPYSEIVDGKVIIKNSVEDAENWWKEKHTGRIADDLMLAKSMSYPLRLARNPTSLVEKIASNQENMFWVEELKTFFDLYKQISTGCVCIILDRSSDVNEWIKNFVLESSRFGIQRTDIKVCFRENENSKNSRFNEWIREQGLGGSVETGRIFIFENKPAKWLFTKDIDVKLIATNNLYPNTNTMTQKWMEHHPCVIYLGSIKPSQKRNLKIVQL